MYSNEDTICACCTSVGSGAVSIIRISGPEAFRSVDSLVTFRSGTASSSKAGRVKYGTIDGLDDVLVSLFRAPHSYTGQDCVEIGCHASAYIVREILSRLVDEHVRAALPGEFTQRAFLAGKMDLSQAEAVADLIGASSAAAHRIALSQVRGEYSSELKALRSQLLELTSLLELELDFSEEDVEFADRGKLRILVDDCVAKLSALASSFRLGKAIKEGVPVAIVGAPNSGKSTLLNALLGEQRAIVSDIPGTTRDTIEETILLNGVLFRFIDTAGLHESTDYVEKLGIERSLAALSSALVVICLLDGTTQDYSVLSEVQSRLSADQHLIIASSKSDLPSFRAYSAGAVAISARSGAGLDALENAICSGFSEAELGSAVIVTNQRHYQALQDALAAMQDVAAGISSNLSGELLSEDLRAALAAIGEITGEISTDEVLGNIFSRFCIGK